MGKLPDRKLDIKNPGDQIDAFLALVKKEGDGTIKRRWPACARIAGL